MLPRRHWRAEDQGRRCAVRRRMESASWRLADVAASENLLFIATCPLVLLRWSPFRRANRVSVVMAVLRIKPGTAMTPDKPRLWRNDRPGARDLYAPAAWFLRSDRDLRYCARELGIPAGRLHRGRRRRAGIRGGVGTQTSFDACGCACAVRHSPCHRLPA